MVTRFQISLKFIYRLFKYVVLYSVYFSERKKKRAWDRRSEAWNKRSTVLTENQMLEVIPEKKGKREMEAMCISYISMFMFRLDTYATEPWYLDILLYPVTLISY